MDPTLHRARIWVFRILTMLTGVILSVAIVEVTLRLFHLAPVGGLTTVTQAEFDRIPGIFTPGQRLVDRTVPQLPYHVTIDSLGYREEGQMSRAKPPGEVRIILLGDSFTFGYLVDDEETLPSQLEHLIQSQCGDSVRIVNAGVGGSSIETAAVMAERAKSLGVDIAVLTFTENDVTDLAAPMWEQLAANRASKSRFPMSIVYPVARRLATWNLLLRAQATWTARQAVRTAPVRSTSAGNGNDSTLIGLREEYAMRLRRLRGELDQVGVPLIFAIFPSHYSVYGADPAEQILWVEQTARAEGITTVNYLDVLRRDGRPREDLFLFPFDGHPSAKAYAVAAPVLARALEELPPLLARCATNGRRDSTGSDSTGTAR